jgi:hypothetical protein
VPDDLPRSPTGRVPQWVVDERVEPPAVPPRPPRRRSGVGILVVLTLALVGAVWLSSGGPGLPDALVPGLSSGLVPAQGRKALPIAPPAPEVVALADAAHLSDEGRQLFYGTRPEVLGAAAFAGRCADTAAAPLLAAGSRVGCYFGGADSIVVYQPADPRLLGSAVETAAHETLHAGWERLGVHERAGLTVLLEAAIATVPADDTVHEQIAGSVGAHPENRPTELFAYLGTQVAGLDPQLEAVYARFVADRPALVAVHTGWVSLLEGMRTDVETSSQALVVREATNAQARAQLTADTSSLDFYRQASEAKAAEVAALPPGQRAGLRLSWVWWDGTDLPMAPAAETLATAASLVARDEVDLAAREAALAAEEAAAAAERARIDGVVADLNELNRQLDPALWG